MIRQILNEIVENKQKEIEADKTYFPLDSFKHKLSTSKKDYIKALLSNRISLIAEIKPKSPSKGVIRREINAKEIVDAYETRAQCISVLTDSKYFGGSLKLLQLVSNYSKLPVLRKDFIIDEYQIYQARLFGADAILLIASLLNIEELKRFLEISRSLGMACQVEVHDNEDLNKVLQTDVRLIGINNRDLRTMKTDINTTIELSKKIPKGRLIVSESGINSHEDLNKIEKYINAVHIGSAFMESNNIKNKIKEIMGD